jgi:predicted ATP-dependent endonuclease of OLD family
MKLEAVQVQNYKSIVDSGIVGIDSHVTVVIGKNEQGKTNFLKALHSFNPKNSYSPNDLPNHLRANLEEKDKSEIPMVSVWLVPIEPHRNTLKELIQTIDDIKQFRVTRYYDGHYEYRALNNQDRETDVTFAEPHTASLVESIRKEAQSLKAKLDSHASRVAAFASAKTQADSHIEQFVASNFTDSTTADNLITTFLTALKGLPGQDPPIQADIASTSKNIEALKAKLHLVFESDPALDFQRLFPHFIFHSTMLDSIPNEVNIPDFIKAPEGTSKGMANLCKVAGLSIQKIQELASATEIQRREVYEDHYRASISGGINEFWTQESYNVHFRIDRDKLSVSISDKTYGRRIAPSDRSDGFQWYLSFYSALLSEVSVTDPMVLLLDNPALQLHADGQRDIKRFLEEKLPATTQVIYVTHSPAMIDTYNLEQVRRVELQGDMHGTKVSKLPLEKEQFDLLEPVRSAIGASLVDTLMTNDFNLLVEGAADKPILEGAFSLFLPNESKKIVINGSISESGLLLPRFYERTRLPFAVFLDADSRGRGLRNKLQDAGIPSDKIIYLGDLVTQTKDYEIEDLFSSSVYYIAVKETYPEFTIEEIKDDEGKRTKRYEDFLKKNYNVGFNKRRVGETLKRLLGEKKSDKETSDNLKTVIDKIWEKLQLQVKRQTG